MNIWMQRVRTGALIRIAIIAVFGVVLTACGGGDDNAEPTATTVPSAAQPTVKTDEATAASPVAMVEETAPPNTDMSSPAGSAPSGTPTAVNDLATAPSSSSMANEPSDLATPDTTPLGSEATPENSVAVASASPAVADENPLVPADEIPTAPVGDGTTGAAVSSLDATEEAPGLASTSAAEASAPVNSASPVASPASVSGTPVAAGQPPVVTSCNVENVPAFTGEVTTYVLELDLNFRSGPGSDCDQIGDGPLGEFSAVEVIGGPVIREGDENPEWLQVRVGEQTGWLAAEFLAPAE